MHEDWVSMAGVTPFIRAAEQVLNARVFLVITPPRAPVAATFAERIAGELARADFGARLDEAVERTDPGEVWDGGAYQPVDRVEVQRLDARQARGRLIAMLTAQPPFLSPYGKRRALGEAERLADAFLSAFSPAPTELAEIDPSFLASWGYLDGFCDRALALGAQGRLAILINNGSD